MYWFALFAGVVVVWIIVLALLGLRLWRQGKALTVELSAAQTRIDAAQAVPTPPTMDSNPHHARHASSQA